MNRTDEFLTPMDELEYEVIPAVAPTPERAERHDACGTRLNEVDGRPHCPRCLVYLDGRRS